VPFFLLGIAALLGVWLSRPLWFDPETRQLKRDLVVARRLLEDPKASVQEVPVLLADALNHIERAPGRLGEAHFLLGSAYLRLAESFSEDRAEETRRKARHFLELADKEGVPENDGPFLRFRLGKVWFYTGGQRQSIIDALSQTVDGAGIERGEGYSLLTKVSLWPPRDVTAALKWNDKHLRLPTSNDELQLAPARLLRAELLLEIKDREGARKVLARLGSGVPRTIFSRARYLKARTFQDDLAYAEAAPLWEAILADPHEKERDSARIWYDLGECYGNLKQNTKAAQAWERAATAGGEAGQAALIRLSQGKLGSNPEAAADGFERALLRMTTPADYHNRLIDLGQARGILESSANVCLDAAKYEAAHKLAALHARLADHGFAAMLTGRVAEGWARSRKELARQVKSPEASQQEEEAARTLFQEAGAAYEAAAAAVPGQPEKADWLWRAGQAYWLAQAPAQVIAVFDKFVQMQPPPEKCSEAWYRLGESHLALHHDGVDTVAFNRCIEQAGPFAFRARLQLAQMELAKPLFGEAEPMLVHILQLPHVESDPETHARTLFTLADLYYRKGEYHKAIPRWEKAFDYAKQTVDVAARFHLAESYRLRADQEMQKIAIGMPSALDHPKQQVLEWLEKAEEQYQIVIAALETRTSSSLTREENAMLRQSLFGRAGSRFDRGKVKEAIPLYDSLATRLKYQYEGLNALRRLFECYVVPEQNQAELASATLQRARGVLEALKDDVFKGHFEGRTDWEKWIRTKEQELNKAK
jgi:tetratricopeptide (TPR) repeat protein